MQNSGLNIVLPIVQSPLCRDSGQRLEVEEVVAWLLALSLSLSLFLSLGSVIQSVRHSLERKRLQWPITILLIPPEEKIKA